MAVEQALIHTAPFASLNQSRNEGFRDWSKKRRTGAVGIQFSLLVPGGLHAVGISTGTYRDLSGGERHWEERGERMVRFQLRGSRHASVSAPGSVNIKPIGWSPDGPFVGISRRQLDGHTRLNGVIGKRVKLRSELHGLYRCDFDGMRLN